MNGIVMARLRSTGRDKWAAAWTPRGDRYMRDKDYKRRGSTTHSYFKLP